jgi:hypothetical protein
MKKHFNVPVIPFILFLLSFMITGCDTTSTVRYVAFGDSATVGVGSGYYDKAYPHQLQLKLSDAGKCTGCEGTAINCCVSNWGQLGETTCGSLTRLQESFNNFTAAETYLYWEGGNDVINYVVSDASNPVNKELNRLPYQSEADHIRKVIVYNNDDPGNPSGCIYDAVKTIMDTRPNVIIKLGTYYDVAPGKPFPNYDSGLSESQAGIFNHYLHVLNKRIYELGADLGIDVAPIGSDSCGTTGTCGAGETFVINYIGGSTDNYEDAIHANGYGNIYIADIWFNTLQSQ